MPTAPPPGHAWPAIGLALSHDERRETGCQSGEVLVDITVNDANGVDATEGRRNETSLRHREDRRPARRALDERVRGQADVERTETGCLLEEPHVR
jgi:hypothetical protein